MDSVKRSAVTMRPKQPYLDWALGLPDPGEGWTLDQLRSEPSVYLIRRYADDEDAVRALAEACEEIFFEELWAWHQDDRDFPERVSLEMLLQWFDVEFSSMVFDTLDDEVEKERED